MRPLPGVDQPGLIRRAPAVVLYAWNIGRLLIELAHVLERQELEGLAIAAPVGKQVEETEEGGEVVLPDGFEEVIREGRTAVGGGDGSDGEDVELAIGEVGREISAVDATLSEC